MGYVFTPREFKEGRIPLSSSYQIAMNKLRDGLVELYNKKIIHGANIHGSSLHSNDLIGGDIDVLIVTNSTKM